MIFVNLFKRIWKYRWMYPYILQTIYFNIRYLPFKQAIHLPILLRKPCLKKMSGRIIINAPIKFGMIELGRLHVSLYPDAGVMIENYGEIVFCGRCVLGAGSKLSVRGRLIFGNNFVSTAGMKIAANQSIEFGANVLIGWDCLFTDSNFHQLSSEQGEPVGKRNAPIKIGSDVWFGFRCACLPGTSVPSKCVVAANSLLRKEYIVPSYSFLAGNPAELKKSGVWRNPCND